MELVLGILGPLSINYINKGKAEHRGLAGLGCLMPRVTGHDGWNNIQLSALHRCRSTWSMPQKKEEGISMLLLPPGNGTHPVSYLSGFTCRSQSCSASMKMLSKCSKKSTQWKRILCFSAMVKCYNKADCLQPRERPGGHISAIHQEGFMLFSCLKLLRHKNANHSSGKWGILYLLIVPIVQLSLSEIQKAGGGGHISFQNLKILAISLFYHIYRMYNIIFLIYSIYTHFSSHIYLDVNDIYGVCVSQTTFQCLFYVKAIPRHCLFHT